MRSFRFKVRLEAQPIVAYILITLTHPTCDVTRPPTDATLLRTWLSLPEATTVFSESSYTLCRGSGRRKPLLVTKLILGLLLQQARPGSIGARNCEGAFSAVRWAVQSSTIPAHKNSHCLCLCFTSVTRVINGVSESQSLLMESLFVTATPEIYPCAAASANFLMSEKRSNQIRLGFPSLVFGDLNSRMTSHQEIASRVRIKSAPAAMVAL